MDFLSEHLQHTKVFIRKKFPWRQVLIGSLLTIGITWWQFTPDGVLGKADAVGFAVCHRIDTRSFHLGDRQIPVCARCTGQYLGAVLGLIYLSILSPRRSGRPDWFIIGILIVLVLAYAVDGINSYLHLFNGLSEFYLYTPNNTLRLLTGTGLGIGISIILYPAFNDTVLARRDRRPVIKQIWDFGLLLLLAAGVDLLVLSNQSFALYPLALVSAAGVLILLTLIYTMVVVMIFRLENSFSTLNKLFYPLLAGFTMALIQISILDYVRYWITGTWAGFHFG
jgi:uncharacterized membrane protein